MNRYRMLIYLSSPAVMVENSFANRLRELIVDEARSCSMDFGCITPKYVHRMLGGTVLMEDIINGFKELQKQGIPVCIGSEQGSGM